MAKRPFARRQAEVEDAHARRAAVHIVGCAPHGGGMEVGGDALRLREVFGGRRVGGRLHPRLHLRFREPDRSGTIEAQDEQRLRGTLRQGGNGLHDARPALRPGDLLVRVVRLEALVVREAVQRDVGHGSGGEPLRLRPDADRVRRVRAKVSHGILKDVPVADLSRVGRDAHGGPVPVAHDGIDLVPHGRTA